MISSKNVVKRECPHVRNSCLVDSKSWLLWILLQKIWEFRHRFDILAVTLSHNHSHPILSPHASSLASDERYSVCFFYELSFLGSICERNNAALALLCWHISLNIMISSSIMLPQVTGFYSSYDWIAFHLIYVPYSIFLFSTLIWNKFWCSITQRVNIINNSVSNNLK